MWVTLIAAAAVLLAFQAGCTRNSPTPQIVRETVIVTRVVFPTLTQTPPRTDTPRPPDTPKPPPTTTQEPTPTPIRPQGKVSHSGTVRAGPGTSYKETGKVEEGAAVIVLGVSENRWYKVRISATLEGWVPTTAIELLQEDREISIIPEDKLPPTPRPTYTRGPTATPTPTYTQVPTVTPKPTDTPTPEPEPVVYTGQGDAVVDIVKPSRVNILHIVGNAAERHFSIESYDSSGDYIDLLVNTTDPYEGYKPLDWPGSDTHTASLVISATGPWTITVLPLSHEVWTAHVLNVPGTFEGKGDNVVLIGSNLPYRATIAGNAHGGYFGVIAYNGGWDLLVNTTDPYEGTVPLQADTTLLEVLSSGAWTITITAR